VFVPDSALGIPKQKTKRVSKMEALVLEILKFSMTLATRTSRRAIVEVRAANNTREKKAVESKTVPGS
jgi:hypothetical protein